MSVQVQKANMDEDSEDDNYEDDDVDDEVDKMLRLR